ncbi:hypothetical protein QT971_17685 [Microcoleus sp. herbarium19]
MSIGRGRVYEIVGFWQILLVNPPLQFPELCTTFAIDRDRNPRVRSSI